MLDINEILEKFKKNRFVLKALQNPRSPSSVLNYICSGDTNDPLVKKSLNNINIVSSLLVIWFQSGQSLDKLCKPFIPTVRELKSKPKTLIGNEWDSIDGKIAKVLLADQLSRSCFRGTSEAFAYDEIARDLVHELFNKKMIEQSIIYFKKVAEDENHEKRSDAMFNIALIYDNGFGIQTDKTRALYYYESASELSNKYALFNLGWMYYNGENVNKDVFKAFELYKMASDFGHPRAMYNLANMYFSGTGTVKDLKMAYKLFLKPDLIIGDLDSIDKKIYDRVTKDKIEIIEYQADKDYTDFEIALKHVINMEIKDITVIGGEYGDIDHLFGSLFNINKLHNDQNILWIHGDQNILFPNSENVEIGVNKNFSVLPFSDLINLTISGAKWNLENEDVEFGVSKTLRNISKNNQIHISVLDGKYCLVINN